MSNEYVYQRNMYSLDAALSGGGFRYEGETVSLPLYRVSSLTRERIPLGPYRMPMPRAPWWSKGGERSLMGEIPL